MELRVAILGSCITRDLWPIRGELSGPLAYVCRTALPSLLSPPVEGFRARAEPAGDLRPAEHAALVADLAKTALRRLLAYRPTHMIFDFVDERFDLLAVGGALASYSGEMVRSGYMAHDAFGAAVVTPRLSAGVERLWLEAAAEFAALVRATPLGEARLILHRARWATHQRTPEGAVTPIADVELVGGRPAKIADYNALLQRQEAAFEAAMPPMTVVEAPALRVADTAHRWGVSPFHYVPGYYDEIRRQLAGLGLAGAFRAAPAAPSAPAA